ncbi:Hypothetical protein, putative, partial [Bodo saltans]
TVTGSTSGSRDGAFSVAQFNQCTGLVYRSSVADGSALFIADYTNNVIRKANFDSKIVSTVITLPGSPSHLAISKDGLRLFASADNSVVYQIYLTNSSAMVLAGASGSNSYVDARGTAARFNRPRGVSLNRDETALFVGDWDNRRLRRIELSNQSVTTVAGTGAQSSVDGALRSSTFVGLSQNLWHCNNIAASCGIVTCGIVTCEYDPFYSSLGNIRWIPLTHGTQSISDSEIVTHATFTPTLLPTPSSTLSPDQTGTASVMLLPTPSSTSSPVHTTTASIMRWTTHTVLDSNELSLSRSMSFGTRTGAVTVTLSRWPSASIPLSSSRAATNTKRSASPTPTSRQTRSASLPLTSTFYPSMSLTPTPSPSLTSDSSTTKSPPTRSKSSTQFDCNDLAPLATGVTLAEVDMTILGIRLGNTSARLTLTGAGATNASFALSDDQPPQRVPPFVFLTSQDVDRMTLLRALPLVFNLTLASPYQLLYYYAGNVTTLQGTNVSATWWVHPRSGVWHGVVAEAPSNGWVGDAVFPVLLYREVHLLVPLMCGDGHRMLTVVLTVPSPGVPRDLAAEVRRATIASLIAALLVTGAVSGSALGRILATDSMVLCDADAAGGGGVIDFNFVICVKSPDLVEA